MKERHRGKTLLSWNLQIIKVIQKINVLYKVSFSQTKISFVREYILTLVLPNVEDHNLH